MFKRLLTTAVCCALTASSLISCGSKSTDDSNSKDKINVVCTIFPEYDWTNEILGDHVKDANVSYLLDNGVDLHSYQPTADDIIKIADCDLFIYVGGESDSWVEDALKEATNKDMHVLNLMEIMGDKAKEEELKEGMQADEEEEESEDEPEYDEHVWLSLKNAEMFCDKISDALCDIDNNNSDDYKSNVSTYKEKLENLDSDFSKLTSAAKNKTLIFGDRFPFRYMIDDYSLDYYAAFIGCSAETEASFKTITFLANKADELNADTIFTIEGSDKKIAQSIIDSTTSKNQTIAELNSIQSVNKEQVENGTSYLSIMQENYSVLKEALK